MSTSINNINRNAFIALNDKTGKEKLPAELDGNTFSNEITSALNQLSQLDNSSKLREDAIRNGKAIIENWQPPTDEQIAKIFSKMKNEYIKVS